MKKIESLIKCFATFGVKRILAKALAKNDTSKNQIYIGEKFSDLNFLPTKEFILTEIKSKSKKEKKASHILRAEINLYWVGEDGKALPAPNSKIIFYPQYPEVRLSGFLLGCERPPSSLLASRLPGRVLFFGMTNCGKIYCYVVGNESDLAKEFFHNKYTQAGVFCEISNSTSDTKKELLEKLAEINAQEWIKSLRLAKDGKFLDCNAPNCGGYTLEAKLGVKSNGNASPDFLGWEVKQFGVNKFGPNSSSVITLMTPEPTGGLYQELGIKGFLKKFGYKDKAGRIGRINFGGIHRVGVESKSTKLTMRLDGFDASKSIINDLTGGIILFSNTEPDLQVARWDFAHLVNHWKGKHAKAVYIQSLKREVGSLEYHYGRNVLLCEGADFSLFLKSMMENKVFYDPGIKMEIVKGKIETKKRSQFRVKFGDVPSLYLANEFVDLKSI